MATYKVWLTVKDSFGNTKELDGGTIDVDLNQVAEDAKDMIDKDGFITKTELDTAIEEHAQDTKPAVYVPNVTPNNVLEFNLQEKPADEHLEFDIDKSNDWNAMEQTTGSNYAWEPMQ